MVLLKLEKNSQIQFSASTKIKSLLMVCSHERSGTHFLINSLSARTFYKSNPLYLYDNRPYLGSDHIFFSEKANKTLINELSNLRVNDTNMCMQSIIKSHFPIYLFGDQVPINLKIAYIYRNPVDLFISYWKLLHSIEFFEGPKTKTPLELAKHVPAGNSQRYQVCNANSYFERWATHVSSANKYQMKSNNVALISYKQLSENHNSSIEELCNKLKIETILKKNEIHDLGNHVSFYIKGANIQESQSEREELYEYCSSQIKNYPLLPNGIMYS